MNRALPVAKFAAIALTLVCLIALPSAYLAAQATGGTIVGTVIDSTGAAVANADVEARSVGTNVATTAKTGDAGLYRFDNLLPGSYKISVKASGFKAVSQSVDVQVSRTFSLNLTLVPGSTSETIEVSGAPPLVDAATPDIGTTYETDTLRSIPTAGAGALGVINLSLLQSGVGSTGGLGAGTGPAVSGQRPRNNNFTVEGIDENDKGVTGPDMYVPNDAVGNFTILQNQFSPEFGHSTGGQFNTTILSGTNSFHGTAYEYFQNRNLNAVDNSVVLSTTSGTAKNPRFDENRFGGQVGGPIFKNKLFFFVNYERTPIGQATIPTAVSAPTANGYSQMAAVLNAAGAPTANIDALQAWAVAPTANGSFPMCLSQGVSGANPQCGGASTPIETGTLPIQAPSWKNNSDLTTSMDYNISNRDQIRGRYVYNKLTKVDNAATLPAFYTSVALPGHLVSLSEFHTFNAAISNELRVGYFRTGFNYVVGNQTFLSSLDAFPNITMDDLGLNVGPDPNAPQYSQQNLYQAVDNVTWIKGAHTLKFGVEGRKYISPQKFIQRSRGDYEWPTLSDFAWDLDPLQDNGFAERSFGNSGYSGDQYAVYWYGNDIWKASRHLSLNFGLRYEYTSTPYGWSQQSLNSIASVPGLVNFGSPRAPKKDFMPRVGFAYSPGESGKMSIRGGFGLGYDVLYDNIGVLSRPPQIGSTVDCPQTCTSNAFLANGGIPFQNLSGITVLDQATARFNSSAFLPTNVKYPYGENWDIGIQRTFGSDYTAEVRYVGTRGVDLNVQNRLNIQDVVTPTNFLPTFLTCNATCQSLQSSPGSPGQLTLDTLENEDPLVPAYENNGFFGSFLVGFMPWGSSTYHGLQAQLEHRMSNGLFFQAAYTFSHMIDNSTADFFSTVIAPRRPQDFRNLPAERANSVLDHRQRFTLSLVYDSRWYAHSPNWFLKNVVGNYQFTPVYFYEVGQWATGQSQQDSNLNLDNAGDRTIWNAAGVSNRGSDVFAICNSSLPVGPNLPTCGASGSEPYVVGYQAVDPTARYIQTGIGALATSGRNTIASPAINNLDLGVSKGFKFGERMEFRFGVLAINALNHPQYTTGFVSQADSFSAAAGGQRNVLGPANSTATTVGLLNFPNGQFGNFKSAFGSNARQLALNAHFSF
jgi:Carboxypeptidase regulatory-like domain